VEGTQFLFCSVQYRC